MKILVFFQSLQQRDLNGSDCRTAAENYLLRAIKLTIVFCGELLIYTAFFTFSLLFDLMLHIKEDSSIGLHRGAELHTLTIKV